jgi:hypothetical protein
MIVIFRNARTVVLTRWRAALVGALALVVAWVAFALLAVLMVGVALTVGVALLVLAPALVVAAAVAYLLNGRPRPQGPGRS